MKNSLRSMRGSEYGFTIVELILVVVIIGILATITVISYDAITRGTAETTLKNDLQRADSELKLIRSKTGAYPDTAADLQRSDDTVFQYSASADAFCLTAGSVAVKDKTFFVTESTDITEGACPGHTGSNTAVGTGTNDPLPSGTLMQNVTASSCTTTRTRVNDARDNHSYWMQRLPDGKCWMLTNLAYAGGGNNYYKDAITLQNGTNSQNTLFDAPRYYIPEKANPTSGATNPSTSTNGGVTAPQYGYFYNWCAAMGAQLDTEACELTDTPKASTSISVCPAGWRLPTFGGTGEYATLRKLINPGQTPSGILTTFLGQYTGYWDDGAFHAGAGHLWSSKPYSTGGYNANGAYFSSTFVDFENNNTSKTRGRAVRCVLN